MWTLWLVGEWFQEGACCCSCVVGCTQVETVALQMENAEPQWNWKENEDLWPSRTFHCSSEHFQTNLPKTHSYVTHLSQLAKQLGSSSPTTRGCHGDAHKSVDLCDQGPHLYLFLGVVVGFFKAGTVSCGPQQTCSSSGLLCGKMTK